VAISSETLDIRLALSYRIEYAAPRRLFSDPQGLTKNDGRENDGPSRLQDLKLQDMKLRDQFAGRE